MPPYGKFGSTEYSKGVTQPSSMPQEINRVQMPFSAEEWSQTPPAVQEFVLSLLVRMQVLEEEVATLREQLNGNSGNSSQPPSSPPTQE
jgi:hypothetical protein